MNIGHLSVRQPVLAIVLSVFLVIAGGLLSLAGIENPRREVPCAECPGGAIVGAPEDLAYRAPTPEPAPA